MFGISLNYANCFVVHQPHTDLYLKNLHSVVNFVFCQLAKMNAEAQGVERELRDELANSISKAVSDADRARIAELEKAETELRIEVSKYV